MCALYDYLIRPSFQQGASKCHSIVLKTSSAHGKWTWCAARLEGDPENVSFAAPMRWIASPNRSNYHEARKTVSCANFASAAFTRRYKITTAKLFCSDKKAISQNNATATANLIAASTLLIQCTMREFHRQARIQRQEGPH